MRMAWKANFKFTKDETFKDTFIYNRKYNYNILCCKKNSNSNKYMRDACLKNFKLSYY